MLQKKINIDDDSEIIAEILNRFSQMDDDSIFDDLLPVDIEIPRPKLPAPVQMPHNLRPRERIIKEGQQALSNRELLALILNTGIKGKNVSVLASDLLSLIYSQKGIPSIKEMSALEGMGEAKACSIAAMLEFGRRHFGNRNVVVRSGDDIFKLIRHYADSRQELFLSTSLNGAHEIIQTRIVTMGLVNKTIAHPREVFADVLQDRASAVCVAHNHPSGICRPSENDDIMTTRLLNAAEILGIQFLDHIIFTQNEFYSYSRNGKLSLF
ncbi:MAG: DNA repair protein RadC [Spirochaetaceae bacterium]|jgi:DNA repair protein RadC|nr:DNA repair protein RadC [Spirochaetaceae bacterium]